MFWLIKFTPAAIKSCYDVTVLFLRHESEHFLKWKFNFLRVIFVANRISVAIHTAMATIMEVDESLLASLRVFLNFLGQFFDEVVEPGVCQILVMPDFSGTKTLEAFVYLFPVILQSVEILQVFIYIMLPSYVKFPIHNHDDYEFSGLKHNNRKFQGCQRLSQKLLWTWETFEGLI